MSARFLSTGSAVKRTIILVLIISIGIHLAAGLVAATWVVVQYFASPPAVFVAKKAVPPIPPKVLEEKMAAAEYESSAAKPSFDDKIASTRATDFALPDLPKMAVEDMMPLDPNTIVSDQITSLVGAGGTGAGGDGQGGVGSGGFGSGVSFLGISDNASRVIIAFDISLSVLNNMSKAGMDIQEIKDETKKLIDGLNINCRFNLVQFARNYDSFASEAVPASDANKQAAKEWLDREFRTDGKSGSGWAGSGRGIQAVMSGIFTMQPECVYVLSDGSFQRSGGGPSGENVPWDELEKDVETLQASLPTKAKIHMIVFGVRDDDWSEVRKFSGRNDGKAKKF
jgi:hypothetical protein